MDKIKQMERKDRELREQMQEIEREKEQVQLDSQNKIQVL